MLKMQKRRKENGLITANMKKVRFGVVGTNFITDWVIAGAREDVRFELAAVCSRTRERGEEFARTKDGMEDSYNAPIAINRLDWEQAWKNRELVEYYRGLLALRRQLPGLCDKSARAAERISHVQKEKGAVSFVIDNRPWIPVCQKEETVDAPDREGKEHKSRWQTLKIVYNSSREERPVTLDGEGWKVLCDGQDSWLWKTDRPAQGKICIAPQSVLILGQDGNAAEAEAAEAAGTAEHQHRGEETTWRKKAV